MADCLCRSSVLWWTVEVAEVCYGGLSKWEKCVLVDCLSRSSVLWSIVLVGVMCNGGLSRWE